METEFPFTSSQMWIEKPTLIAEQGYGGIDLVELEFVGDNIILEEATIDGENFNNVLSVGNITTEGDVVYRTPNIATGGQFTTSLTFGEPTANRTITIPQETGTVITTGSIDAITRSMMANDSVSSVELKTLSTLLIKNSSGSTLKTVHGAGRLIMTARSPLYYDGSGSLVEMTSEVTEWVTQTVFQYGSNPSAVLTRVASSGANISAIDDTRLKAGNAFK